MKFEKPFSSFPFSANYKWTDTLKERWRIALHDPVYLMFVLCGIILGIIIYLKTV